MVFAFGLIRVHVDPAGVSVPLEPWKVLTTLQPESLLASASSSLWIVIMRFESILPCFAFMIKV